jgi:hypothetical protein
MSDRRPTLLNSCARAATAAEARFRIDDPNSSNRASRIVSLDQTAAAIVARVAEQPWQGARFLSYVGPSSDHDGGPDAALRSFDGEESRLSDELDGADVAVMVATGPGGADGAATIGQASFRRRIMTAGLVVGEAGTTDAAVQALRPYASVLVVSSDESYIRDVLTALRA